MTEKMGRFIHLVRVDEITEEEMQLIKGDTEDSIYRTIENKKSKGEWDIMLNDAVKQPVEILREEYTIYSIYTELMREAMELKLTRERSDCSPPSREGRGAPIERGALMNEKQKYLDTNLSEKNRELCGAEKDGFACSRTKGHTDKHEAGIGGGKAVFRWHEPRSHEPRPEGQGMGDAKQ